MARKPRVFIPLFALGTQQGCLEELRIRPANEDEQRAKDLPQPIEYLLDICGESAKAALSATLSWLTERLPQGASALNGWRLEFCNVEIHVNGFEDRSSDLGLALGLLLAANGGNGQGTIVATGKLEQEAILDDSRRFDYAVRPVAGLPEKLQALLELIEQGEKPSRTVLLLPDATPSGLDLPSLLNNHPADQAADDAEWRQLREQFKALRAVGVEIHPVASLGAAAKVLGIKPPAQTARKRRRPWLWSLALLGLVGGYVGFAFYRYASQPIVLGDGRPFRPHIACLDAGDPPALTKPPVAIRQSQAGGESMPVVPPHAQLAWEIPVGTAEEAASWPRRLLKQLGYPGYQTAIVLVGELSGVKRGDSVRPPKRTTSVWPGGLFRHSKAVEGTLETNLLVLLVNRYRRFNSSDLERLEQELTVEWQKAGLSAVRAYLETQADATLEFRFRTEGDDYACR